MQPEVATDLRQSAMDFLTIVWPRIFDRMGGGRLYPVEMDQHDREIAAALDVMAGIDAWQLCDDAGQMRGLASRVQWCDVKPYDTFTVRWRRGSGVATEVDKRLAALHDPGGWLSPALTIQAYLREHDRAFLSAGIIRTVDLFLWIEQGGARDIKEKWNTDRSSTFKPIPWRQLVADGVRVGIVRGAS